MVYSGHAEHARCTRCTHCIGPRALCTVIRPGYRAIWPS